MEVLIVCKLSMSSRESLAEIFLGNCNKYGNKHMFYDYNAVQKWNFVGNVG